MSLFILFLLLVLGVIPEAVGYAETDWKITTYDDSLRNFPAFANECCDELTLYAGEEAWQDNCCLPASEGTFGGYNCDRRERWSCPYPVVSVNDCIRISVVHTTQYKCPYSCHTKNVGRVYQFANQYGYNIYRKVPYLNYFTGNCKGYPYLCSDCVWKACDPNCDIQFPLTRMKKVAKDCSQFANTQCEKCDKLPYYYTYMKTNINVNDYYDCSPDRRNYYSCDECTPPSFIPNSNPEEVNCPPFNPGKGRPPGITEVNVRDSYIFVNPAGSQNKCLPCQTCEKVVHAISGVPLYYYFNPSGTNVNCVTVPQSQCIYSHIDSGSNPSTDSTMPFIYGKRRNPGIHTTSKTTLDYKNQDILPYYENCNPSGDFKLPEQYRRRVEKPIYSSFAKDCDARYIGECARGYYADSLGHEPTFAITCTTCGPEGSNRSPGGFLRHCECLDGFATATAIKSALNSFMHIDSDSESTCISCLQKVSFRNSLGVDWQPQQERIVCTAAEIRRCKGNEFVSSDNPSKCTVCPDGYTALEDKSDCQQCAIGKYMNKTECVDCNTDYEYCPNKGMSAPLPRILSCSKGQVFLASLSPLGNNKCIECPTQCADGAYLVFASGHNITNGCSQTISGRQYFACYNGESHLDNQKYRTVYSYDAATNSGIVTASPCASLLLPENADWVDGPSSIVAKECFFACKHGWNKQLAEELQLRIRQMVADQRLDLQNFVDQPFNIQDSNLRGVGESGKIVNKKSNKITPPSGKDQLRWEVDDSTTATADIDESIYFYRKNTFLFVDELMVIIAKNQTFMGGLCLKTADAYVNACPAGFSLNSNANIENLQCAIYARTNGVFKVVNNGVVEYNHVVLAGNSIQCAKRAVEDSLWIPYSLCKSCLDTQYELIDAISSDSQLSATNQERRTTMRKWLNPNPWRNYFFEKRAFTFPYAFGMNCGTAAPSADTREFFTIRLENNILPDIQAIIPCNFLGGGPEFCSNTRLGYYNATGICYNGSPCARCEAWPDHVLSRDEEVWSSNRGSWALKYKVCKYACYGNDTSNRDPMQYEKRPCVPCNEVIENFTANGLRGCTGGGDKAFFFDVENADVECKGTGISGISEYTPQCSECRAEASSDLIFSTNELFASNGDCVALCDPEVYQTLFWNETANQTDETKRPIKQSLILQCRMCTDLHVVSCNNSQCVADYYREHDGCRPCETAPCYEPGYFRTSCAVNSISDSRCARCDGDRLLYNDFEAALRVPKGISWSKALNVSQLDYSRRWVSLSANGNASVFVSEEGCALTCINNYVWIDFKTGKPPAVSSRLLQPYYACVPCNSDFIRESFIAKDEMLYSIWNYSGGMTLHKPITSSISSTLRYMQQNKILGGCYLCPPYTNTIEKSDIMCQVIPGYGTSVDEGMTVQITNKVIDDTSTFNYSFPIIQIPSKKPPAVVSTENQYSSCCLDSDQDCKMQYNKAYEGDQSSITAQNSYWFCMNITRRRRHLLQASGDLSEIQKCKAGQYNHIRGGTVCFDCPLGASTMEPYDGISERKKCACVAGYYAIRNSVSGRLDHCEPCGFNRHRTSLMNDSSCEACPVGKITPTDTSVNCYCADGSYPSPANETCIVCEAGGYCESGASRVLCPENSWSGVGAKTRSDCKCNRAGFYGSLANPGSVCRKVPPTMLCENQRCECASGWYPVYNSSADGMTTVMRCMTECPLGHYAVIDSITFQKLYCRPCPLDSYSSSKQTIYAGEGRQQCTPCPPKFQTVSVGSTAPSQCACLSGIKNATTSECGSCPPDTYLNTFKEKCESCPAGSTSPAGSVGFSSCMCGKGSRTTFREDNGNLQCEQCPLNTYAPSAGFSCTRCPEGMVTLARGSTSSRQCLCPGGKVGHAGLC